MEDLDRCAVCDCRLDLDRVFAGTHVCTAHERLADAEAQRLKSDLQANDR